MSGNRIVAYKKGGRGSIFAYSLKEFSSSFETQHTRVCNRSQYLSPTRIEPAIVGSRHYTDARANDSPLEFRTTLRAVLLLSTFYFHSAIVMILFFSSFLSNNGVRERPFLRLLYWRFFLLGCLSTTTGTERFLLTRSTFQWPFLTRLYLFWGVIVKMFVDVMTSVSGKGVFVEMTSQGRVWGGGWRCNKHDGLNFYDNGNMELIFSVCLLLLLMSVTAIWFFLSVFPPFCIYSLKLYRLLGASLSMCFFRGGGGKRPTPI